MIKKVFLGMFLIFFTFASTFAAELTTRDKLQQWRRGVWLLGDGSYTVYTDTHYFVISANGDSASTNIYCGSSVIQYTEKGMARKQVLRIRKRPGADLQYFKEENTASEEKDFVLQIDMSQFQVGTCNIQNGIIYDSVTEVTDEYILLSTCNGDKEKIYSDGRSAYLPANGGEYWSYRVESW